MELIDIIPEFNLYEEFWKIYTKSDAVPPQYISAESKIERSIISGGSEIYGDVFNSVIGSGVTIGKGTVVRDSIIMKNTDIGENCVIDKAIIAEEAGMNSHAAVVGLSLDIPVILGAANATKILKSGAVVTVDGETGIVSYSK